MSLEDGDTRDRLLHAATRLFAEKGFAHVTVRELCREAGANVAAVNYHFGGKLELYQALFEWGLSHMDRDPMTDAPGGASPEERIRHYVQAFVPRLMAPTQGRVQFSRLMRHEMVEPTPLAPWIAERLILPRLHYLAEAIAEMMDTEPDDPVVRRCVTSLQSQCLSYAPSPFHDVAFPERSHPSEEAIQGAVEHVVAFTLAGIRGLAGQ